MILIRKLNNDNGLECWKTEHQAVTRNIRKPGDVGNLNFCKFTQNCNGLIGWSFDTPAYAYCQPLTTMQSPKNVRCSILLKSLNSNGLDYSD